MAIVKMKRLELSAVKTQREELLREMMLLGCVEISQPDPIEEESEFSGILSREAAGYFERKRDHDILLRAVALLDKYAPKKSGLFTARPLIEGSAILDKTSLEKAIELANRLDDLDGRIGKFDAKVNQIKGNLEGLEPWKNMDVPLNMTSTANCFIQTGMIPSTFELKAAESELSENCEAALFEISADEEMRYLLLVGMKDKQSEIFEILRKFSFSQGSVAGLVGTAKENIDKLNRQLSEIYADKEKLSEEIRQAAPERDNLKLCSDRMMTVAEQAEHAERLLYTISTFAFDGWIPADKEVEVTALFEKYDCAWSTREPTDDETPVVPIKLKNNFVTRPFTMITEMYSLPSYKGIDPNALIMPTFALFFGIMFSDLAYGLIMIIAGLLIKYKIRARTTVGYMGGIAIVCGISCMIFGAITGTFFGDIIPRMAEYFGGSVIMPMLIDPLAEPMTILIICVALGIVHLLLGVTVNGYMLIRDGKIMDAVWDVGMVYVVFAGVALMALGVTSYVLYAGILGVVIAAGREAKGIVGKIGSGLWGLYNFVTGWFGDILSYCRLMALMLAGIVIAQVFNTLGIMTGNMIAIVLIFLIGHSLNFGLNIIGAYVHTSRLEYLEFFGKFYRDNGKPFTPLTMKTNYYDVIKN